jgi:adenine-specific DNA-methyltransferase
MEKRRLESLNMIEKNIDKIGALFPNVITEHRDATGKLKKTINFALLKQLLSDDLVDGDEAYEFTWVGKKASILEAGKPSKNTLHPSKEKSKNWDTTGNLYIEGDNLDVLKLLQESYNNSIKMIYIDPPYNTGKDFIYRDNFTVPKDVYENNMRFFDEEKNHLFQNHDSSGRFHSDWCSMMYPRLKLARNLLSDDGTIFISIDDNEVENLKKIGNEVFGESNFVGQWNWFKSATPANLSKKIKKNIEYILCYEKSKNSIKYRGLMKTSKSNNGLMNQTNSFSKLVFPANKVDTKLKNGVYRKGKYGTRSYEINLLEDTEVYDGFFIKEVILEGRFKWGQDNLNREMSNGTIISIKTNAFSPSYEKAKYDPEVPPSLIDEKTKVDTTENAGKYLKELFDGINVFDYPKPVSLIKYLIGFNDDKDSIILDFFSGSSTTAQAVMELNAEDGGHRKFIMVQLPEKCGADSAAAKGGYATICEIGQERIRRAGEIIEVNKSADEKVDIGFRVLKLENDKLQ